MFVLIITSCLFEEIYIIKADHFDIEKNCNQCCLCVESIMSKKLTKDSIIIQGWFIIFVDIVFQLYDCLMFTNIDHVHKRHLYNCHLLCLPLFVNFESNSWYYEMCIEYDDTRVNSD